MPNNPLVFLLGSAVLTIVNCDDDHHHHHRWHVNCPWGFIRNGPYCVDFNECFDRRTCGGAVCVNTIGSYRCECGPGYLLSGGTCIDVNECMNANICGRARCVNTLGSYRCECPDGYSQSGNTCVDVNECLNPKNCPPNSNCVNTAGSYRCECFKGFVPSGYSCVDFHECTTNPCEHICTNTVGGFMCGCNPGYIANPVTFGKCVIPVQCNPGYRPRTSNPGQCEDIDECTSNPCEQVCTNTVGSYTCSCNTGYAPSTTDFRKCAKQVQCNSGYRLSTSNPGQCEDIDECTSNPCEQVCTNRVGSYTCSCNTGYTPSTTDFQKCVDIDECTSNPCDQVCTNTVGSYTCSCNTGYVPSTTDFRKCVSTVQCKQGYQPSISNPGMCEDIDECQEFSPCEQNCKNIDGDYRCSCNEGYDVDSDDFKKCVKMQMCSATIDIIFVIDSSASLGPTNNKLQLEYASDIVKHFNIAPDKAKIAALLFGNNPKKLFDLKDYTSTDDVSQRILNAGYLREQSTGTDKAFRFITTDGMFSAQSGGRTGVRSAIVVMTDGKATNAAQTTKDAKAHKDNGVEIYSIGIGKSADKTELEAIASNSDHVFMVPDFESLDYEVESLSESLCQGIP